MRNATLTWICLILDYLVLSMVEMNQGQSHLKNLSEENRRRFQLRLIRLVIVK